MFLVAPLKFISPVGRVTIWMGTPSRIPSWRSLLCQGRSQDFSVGTHSFPSHLFTPAPPQKISKSFSIHVSFISNRVRKSLNWMQINLFFCLLFLWVSMCERHCLSCESTTFCSSPFASIYVTYYKKQQCVHKLQVLSVFHKQKLSHCIERLNKKYFSVILLVYNHPAILPHPYYSEGNFNILVIGRLDIQIIRNSKHGNATVTQTEFQLT